MRESMLVISLWLHLLAAVIWVGGIASILFVVLPSARAALGADAAKLMGAVSKKFTPMANVSIALVVVTGAVLVLSGNRVSMAETAGISWPLPFVVKLFAASAMVLVHLYRNLFLAPRIARTSPEASRAPLQRLSLDLVRANFIIGLAALFLSAMAAVR